jgi:hypothetical protein
MWRGSLVAMAAVGARVHMQVGARVAFYRCARERGEGRWRLAQDNGGRRGRDKAVARTRRRSLVVERHPASPAALRAHA